MRDLKREIKELKKDIWRLRLEILKDTGAVVGISVVAVLGTLLEAIAKFSKYAIFMRLFNGEDPFDADLEAPELFYDVADHAGEIKDSFVEIIDTRKAIKELKKELEAEKNIVPVQDTLKPTFSNEVLEYVRTLFLMCEKLDPAAQKEFTVRLKDLLRNYTDTFVAILEHEEKTNDQDSIPALNSRTIEKLRIIEEGIQKRIKVQKQVSSIRTEEQELLSMVPSEEETPTEVQVLKLKK